MICTTMLEPIRQIQWAPAMGFSAVFMNIDIGPKRVMPPDIMSCALVTPSVGSFAVILEKALIIPGMNDDTPLF